MKKLLIALALLTGTGWAYAQSLSGGVCAVCENARGADGPQGPIGYIGATGATGSSGGVGATGTAGSAGATGTAGADGATGTAGGVGATGATGTAGADGATGAAGSNGATGSTGTSGATGASGPTTPFENYTFYPSPLYPQGTSQGTMISLNHMSVSTGQGYIMAPSSVRSSNTIGAFFDMATGTSTTIEDPLNYASGGIRGRGCAAGTGAYQKFYYAMNSPNQAKVLPLTAAGGVEAPWDFSANFLTLTEIDGDETTDYIVVAGKDSLGFAEVGQIDLVTGLYTSWYNSGALANVGRIRAEPGAAGVYVALGFPTTLENVYRITSAGVAASHNYNPFTISYIDFDGSVLLLTTTGNPGKFIYETSALSGGVPKNNVFFADANVLYNIFDEGGDHNIYFVSRVGSSAFGLFGKYNGTTEIQDKPKLTSNFLQGVSGSGRTVKNGSDWWIQGALGLIKF